MNVQESAENVVRRVIEAIANGQAIDYAAAVPDNEHPGISWSIFGLPATGEIAVLVRAGELRLGRAAKSTLLEPPMYDRVFGIDVDDEHLAKQLSDELWLEHSIRLIEVALDCRGS